MLRPHSLLGQNSGFVPFGAGGSVHGVPGHAAARTALALERARRLVPLAGRRSG